MSFDLYVFPRPAPVTTEQVEALMGQDEQRLDGGGADPEPAPEMQAFLAELESRWPTTGGDQSPWAFWPLWQPLGPGTVLNIRWSHAEEMTREIVTLAEERGLAVFDPQEGRPAG
jgi:hypothetical protein